MNEDAEPIDTVELVKVEKDPGAAWAAIQAIAIVVFMIGLMFIEPIEYLYTMVVGR